jgi:hypothetical protein
MAAPEDFVMAMDTAGLLFRGTARLYFTSLESTSLRGSVMPGMIAPVPPLMVPV